MKIGDFSRGGVARGSEAVQAADHDMNPDAVLVPAGVLEVEKSQLNLFFGESSNTSDFIADVLERWWENRCDEYTDIRRLQIDLDNGPEIASSRTQFMKRLVEFSDKHQLYKILPDVLKQLQLDQNNYQEIVQLTFYYK